MELRKKASNDLGWSSILHENLEEKLDKAKKDNDSLKNIVNYLAGTFDAFDAQFTAFEMRLNIDGNIDEGVKEFLGGVNKSVRDINKMKNCNRYKELMTSNSDNN